jgi:hypothetical protein
LGITLTWLNESPEQIHEAARFLAQAFDLDRYNHLISAQLGWYCMQVGDYPGARFWFATSLNLEGSEKNYLARLYEPIIKARIQEAVREQKWAEPVLQP